MHIKKIELKSKKKIFFFKFPEININCKNNLSLF